MGRPDDLGIHELATRLRDGDGHAPADLRRAALDGTAADPAIRGVVQKVAYEAASITDDDLASAQRVGLGDDELWEVIVCAAVGQSIRQYDAGLAALRAALDPGRWSA